MESLALLVALIVLGIIVLGLFAVFTVARTPRSHFARGLTAMVNAMGLVSGAWLALLEVGSGARVIGLVVFAASAVSLVRLLRSRGR